MLSFQSFDRTKLKVMDTRPWLKNYPSGMPANIDADAFPSLIAYSKSKFEQYAALKAYTFMGKSLTYKQIDEMSTAFGAYLHSRGMKAGDRIAMMMPNCLQYPIAIFGALKAGIIIVNVNPLYTPHEMEFQFKDSKAKAIVIAENFAKNLETVLSNTSIEIVITTSIGEMLGFFKGGLIDFVVKHVKGMVPTFHIDNTIKFCDALETGKKFTLVKTETKPEDVILLQYTGGTTGVSKGTMLTNRNLIANVFQIRAVISSHLQEGKEVALSPLPTYHIFAFAVNIMAMMSLGANTVLVVNARDIPSLIKEFKKNKISLITGVNTLFNALLHHPEFPKLDFSSLKVSVGGGMAVQTSVAENWKKVTGCDLCEGYGMTETSPVISINPIDGSGRLGTIGMPVPSTEIKIINEQGMECGFNEAGEILVRGPQVMKGYYNRPDETEKVMRDGWLYTGDIATMDTDGFLKIVDRKKDMILVSGFNVYPNEIEDVIALNDKVLEVAVIGVPDEKSGETVKAFIVKKDKSLTSDEIIAHCKKYLTNYKMPKQVEFRDQLPKTNVGKILRRELRSN
jgi:long-chain acyl-CoA synthetase